MQQVALAWVRAHEAVGEYHTLQKVAENEERAEAWGGSVAGDLLMCIAVSVATVALTSRPCLDAASLLLRAALRATYGCLCVVEQSVCTAVERCARVAADLGVVGSWW